MREILFRGKSKVRANSNWCYGYLTKQSHKNRRRGYVIDEEVNGGVIFHVFQMPEYDEVHIIITLAWDKAEGLRLKDAWEFAQGKPVKLFGSAFENPANKMDVGIIESCRPSRA
jgi:hypothetical protein